MPRQFARFIAGWQTLHPHWQVRMWGEDDLSGLRNRGLFDRASQIAPGSEGQFCSDVARYEILYRYGGVYVDCDFEALRPIDELCEVDAFAAWETDDVWVNNAVLGCTPGHELMHDLIVRLPANVRRNRGKRPNHLSGPRFLTPIARRHHIEVYPSRLFYPYRWDELDRAGESFPDAYAVHHWANARKRKGKPLE